MRRTDAHSMSNGPLSPLTSSTETADTVAAFQRHNAPVLPPNNSRVIGLSKTTGDGINTMGPNEVPVAEGSLTRGANNPTAVKSTDQLPTIQGTNMKGIKREASADSPTSSSSSRPSKRVGSIHFGHQNPSVSSKQPPGTENSPPKSNTKLDSVPKLPSRIKKDVKDVDKVDADASESDKDPDEEDETDNEQQGDINDESKGGLSNTNLNYSPFFRPKYIRYLDPDVSANEMRILHLLLKRERPSGGRAEKFSAFRISRTAMRQKGKESAPGAEDSSKKGNSKTTANDSVITLNAYYLEICRAVAKGGWKTGYIHSSFPFLEDWKFSAKSQDISLQDWRVTLDYTPPKISPYMTSKNGTNEDGTIKQEEIDKSVYFRAIHQDYGEATAGGSGLPRRRSMSQLTATSDEVGPPPATPKAKAANVTAASRPIAKPQSPSVSQKTQKQRVEVQKTQGRVEPHRSSSSSSLLSAASQGFRTQVRFPVNASTTQATRPMPTSSTDTLPRTATPLVGRMEKLFADICAEVDSELKRRTTGPSAEQFKLLNEKVERIQAEGEIIQQKANQFEKVSKELKEAREVQESLKEDNESLRQQLENMQKVKLEGSALQEENESLKKKVAKLRVTIQNLMEE